MYLYRNIQISGFVQFAFKDGLALVDWYGYGAYRLAVLIDDDDSLLAVEHLGLREWYGGIDSLPYAGLAKPRKGSAFRGKQPAIGNIPPPSNR